MGCIGIANGKCALALAVLFVIMLLNVELSQADDCNKSAIISSLRPCLGSSTDPDRDSVCCGAMRNVMIYQKPSGACICALVDDESAAAMGMNPAVAKKVIGKCVGASSIPPCLD